VITKRRDILACTLLLAVAATPSAQQVSDEIVIEHVTIVSPERAVAVPDADVLIRDGRIAAIGKNVAREPARHVDGKGKFLIPGLIDSHVHVGHSAALDDKAIAAHPELWTAYREQVPRAYLAFGFTSIVDLDLTPRDQAWFKAIPLRPRFYHCGGGIKVAGGYTAFSVPPASSPNFPNFVFEPQDARSWPSSLNREDFTPARAVGRAADRGATCIKAFVESGFGIFHWPYLHTETLRDLRAEAHRRMLPLVVHATSVESWEEALAAKSDVIAHGLWIWPGDQSNPQPPQSARAVIAAVARRGTYVQPTLQVVAGERSFADPSLLNDARLAWALPGTVIAYLRSADGVKTREALLEDYRKASPAPGFDRLLSTTIQRTQETFRLMLRDKVRLILGSDTPSGDGFGNPPGLNGRLEMQDWADAGAPLKLILQSATLENAKALGLAREVGSIEIGKRADLLLLRQNPLTSVSAYDSIETIFLDGQPIARDALRPGQ
jgi:imidazolonepropionase-like amidohydrolase